YLVPSEVAILPIVLFPISLGAAVLSRQFLGIQRVVRRGLVALVVWLVLLGIYSFALVLIGDLERRGDGLGALLASPVLVVAVIVATFPVLQSRLRQGLEQLLFRDTYSYADTLRALGDEIVRLVGAEAIAGHVLQRLGETLDLTWAAVALRDQSGRVAVYHWGDCPPAMEELVRLHADVPTEGDRGREIVPSIAMQFVPLVAEGVYIGDIAVGQKRHDVELLPDDANLLSTIAPLVATALKNAMLLDQLQLKVAALAEREQALGALSARLMEVQEEERRRLSLDLHDDPLQRAILLARETGESATSSEARRWHRAADDIIVSLRAICTGLRPPELDDLGLVASLESLVDEVVARSDLTVSFSVEPSDLESQERLERDLEVALYRVAQEALNNCLKHAGGTQVDVSLWRGDNGVVLRVVDDGKGMPGLDGGSSAGSHESLHLGFLGMRERLRPWEGVVTVESAADGGTVLTAAVPVCSAQVGKN
ncbi:MAG: Histidine kinase protein, partial [Chloroflexi bacterium]|nr:Histidine kinase protein [Chloroflexota bacterium]